MHPVAGVAFSPAPLTWGDRGQRAVDGGENAAAAAGAKEEERAAVDAEAAGEAAGEAASRSEQLPAAEEVIMRARPPCSAPETATRHKYKLKLVTTPTGACAV